MRLRSTFSRLIALAVVLGTAAAGCGGGESLSARAERASGSHDRSTQSIVRLGRYNVDKTKTAVAGNFSGDFTAVQLQAACPGTFRYAISAGDPYYCAQDSLITPQEWCAAASALAAAERYLDSQSSAGTIDPRSNLNGEKAYLSDLAVDFTREQKTMNDLNTEHQNYRVSTKYDNIYGPGHGWESLGAEVACGTTAIPYMIDCSSYDSQKTWLTYFYGSMNTRNTGTLGRTLINFDQTPYGCP